MPCWHIILLKTSIESAQFVLWWQVVWCWPRKQPGCVGTGRLETQMEQDRAIHRTGLLVQASFTPSTPSIITLCVHTTMTHNQRTQRAWGNQLSLSFHASSAPQGVFCINWYISRTLLMCLGVLMRFGIQPVSNLSGMLADRSSEVFHFARSSGQWKQLQISLPSKLPKTSWFPCFTTQAVCLYPHSPAVCKADRMVAAHPTSWRFLRVKSSVRAPIMACNNRGVAKRPWNSLRTGFHNLKSMSGNSISSLSRRSVLKNFHVADVSNVLAVISDHFWEKLCPEGLLILWLNKYWLFRS